MNMDKYIFVLNLFFKIKYLIIFFIISVCKKKTQIKTKLFKFPRSDQTGLKYSIKTKL